MTDDEVIMSLGASAPRRWSGILTQFALGAVLFGVAVFAETEGVMTIVFLILAMVSFYGGILMRRVTRQQIELTDDVLRLSDGRVLTRLDNVKSVERGAFAFKPSNGFLVRLKEPSGKGWAPGVWWQRGRMLGIGGTIPGGQAKAMADTMAVMVSEREQNA